jgi:hypothetical protein
MPPGQRAASATKDAELETLLKLLGDNFNVSGMQVLVAPSGVLCAGMGKMAVSEHMAARCMFSMQLHWHPTISWA